MVAEVEGVGEGQQAQRMRNQKTQLRRSAPEVSLFALSRKYLQCCQVQNNDHALLFWLIKPASSLTAQVLY